MAKILGSWDVSASITDIRRNELHDTLAESISTLLRPVDGKEKKLPTLLLYDDAGLKLFEKITFLDEYYLTNTEIEVLETHAQDIAKLIPEGAMVVELGSGNLRKVNIILKALDAAKKDVDYYALDLSKSELERTLAAVPPGSFSNVRCHGLLGTYDDALEWLHSPAVRSRPKCVMTLGSSIGNFDRLDAAAFLSSFAEKLSPSDTILVGVDNCQDADRVFHAYNDKYGVTHEFVLNGLVHANRVLGYDAFQQGMWRVIGEYDTENGRHQAFVTPNRDVIVDGVSIAAEERVRIEESYKYSSSQANQLWLSAGLDCYAAFGNGAGSYHINMLSKSSYAVSTKPSLYAATAVPSFQEWKQLWALWDLATRKMIPQDDLLSKPIKLRNCCLFYLGHIPTFLDIHLTRCTDGKPTPPSHYPNIFERGIDPDVDNPEQCHAHSEIPDEWPPVEEILQFQQDVRKRIESIYNDGSIDQNPKLRRVLNLGFEHEVMHLETFLYMLLQSDHVIPPTSPLPDFAALAKEAGEKAVPNKWFQIPTSTITLGRDDDEDNYNAGHYFSWDNEYPAYSSNVAAFEAQARPLSNGDYAHYMLDKGIAAGPSSWTTDSRPDSGYDGPGNSPTSHNENSNTANGETFDRFIRSRAVRTVYGSVPLRLALDWPVMASYDELSRCASFYGGRIPTLEEARSIYNFAEQQRLEELSHVPSETIPAVNAHLCNDGVHQTPPSDAHQGGSSPDSLSEQAAAAERQHLFADLSKANVGFNNFHPVPVTQNGNRLSGLGEMGGAWEWTSSALSPHKGFKAMNLYPGYTSDFFDEKHNIVLGGSWATHPRIAGRKTFVNWYQRNYPYVWAGARVVRDI